MCNIKRQLKTLLFLTSLLFIQSCLTVSKYQKSETTPLKDIRLLEGTYSNFNNNGINYRNAYQLINWKANKTYSADTACFATFNIKVVNHKKINFAFQDSSGRSFSKAVKFKLKDNQFLLLKNRNFRLTGLPYILGYYDIKKLELGLDKNNDLIINGVEKGEGAILIVLGSGYPKTNFSLEYSRR